MSLILEVVLFIISLAWVIITLPLRLITYAWLYATNDKSMVAKFIAYYGFYCVDQALISFLKATGHKNI